MQPRSPVIPPGAALRGALAQCPPRWRWCWLSTSPSVPFSCLYQLRRMLFHLNEWPLSKVKSSPEAVSSRGELGLQHSKGGKAGPGHPAIGIEATDHPDDHGKYARRRSSRHVHGIASGPGSLHPCASRASRPTKVKVAPQALTKSSNSDCTQWHYVKPPISQCCRVA